MKSYLNIQITFLLWEWSNSGAGRLEMLWSLHPQRYSRKNKKKKFCMAICNIDNYQQDQNPVLAAHKWNSNPTCKETGRKEAQTILTSQELSMTIHAPSLVLYFTCAPEGSFQGWGNLTELKQWFLPSILSLSASMHYLEKAKLNACKLDWWEQKQQSSIL